MRTNQKFYLAAMALALVLTFGGTASAECIGNPGTIASLASATDLSLQSQVWSAQWADSPFGFYYTPFGARAYCYAAQVCPPLVNPGGSFWVAGGGDPAVPAGTDNGLLDLATGLPFYAYSNASYNYYNGAFIQTSFGPGTGTDGCPQGGDCLCMLLTDQTPDATYFGLVSSRVQATLTTTLNQPGSDGSGNLGAPIILQAVPSVTVQNSFRNPTGSDDTMVDLQLTVSIDNSPMGGVYVGDGCDCGPIGYKILQQVLPRGGAAPADRSPGAWSESVLSNGSPQSVTMAGMPTTVRVDCADAGSGEDIYVTAELYFDSGFTTQLVSQNSFPIQCGAGVNLADPNKPAEIRPDTIESKRGGPRRR